MTIICLLELTPTLLQMQFFKHFHNFFVVQDNGQTLLKFGSLIITVIYLDFPIFSVLIKPKHRVLPTWLFDPQSNISNPAHLQPLL
jgi:hypothetical protein